MNKLTKYSKKGKDIYLETGGMLLYSGVPGRGRFDCCFLRGLRERGTELKKNTNIRTENKLRMRHLLPRFFTGSRVGSFSLEILTRRGCNPAKRLMHRNMFIIKDNYNVS